MKIDDIEKIYTLSPMQQGIMFESILDEGNVFVSQFLFEIREKLQLDKMKRAYDEIVNKYAILRTNFLYEYVKSPLQYVLKNCESDFQIIYLKDELDQDNQVEEIRKKEKEEKWDLSRESLSRIKLLIYDTDKSVMIWSAHHILMDGWCMGILMNEFFETYNQLCLDNYSGGDKEVPYLKYVDYLKTKNVDTARKFWSGYLENYERKCSLTERTSQSKFSHKIHDRYSFKIQQKFVIKLENIARSNGVTINNVFLAIWGILMHHVTQEEDVLVGTVISGRNHSLSQIDKMVGLFINTVPMRMKIQAGMTVNKIILNINKNMVDIEKYGYISLNKILAETSLKKELFDCLFVFENYPITSGNKNKDSKTFYLDSVKTYEQNNYGFTVTILPGNEYEVIFSYDDGYTEEYIKLLEAYFKELVDEICSGESVTIDELSILSNKERQRVLYEFNDTIVKSENFQSVVDLFEEQVELNQDCMAVCDKNKKITYDELNRCANQLARRLIGSGIGPGKFVAVVAERSVEFIIGIIAVLKAGGAYVPIDKNYPMARIQSIIEDCNAEIVMIQNANMVMEGNYRQIIIDDMSLYTGENTNLLERFQMSDAAYAIYTSGTTGKSKGMVIEHHSLSNYMMIGRKYYVKNKPCIPLITNISFDMSVTPIFFTLCNGGELITLTGDMDEMLEDAFYGNKFSLLVLTPSHLKIALTLGEKVNLQNMQDIIVGGEEFETSLADEVGAHFGRHIRIHNQYGPTETTVACCEYQYTGNETSRTVSIGKPTSNVQIYILNGLKLCGVKIIGELCIAGAGVGRGYLNCPELNEEKFIQNPFGEGVLYRSGDMACWDTRGNLEYFGRIDDQIKIRGNRIEIGEIEKVALGCDGINAVAVKVLEMNGKDKSIGLYYVADEEKQKQLGLYLRERLPEYMIPTYYIQIDQIPISGNGKVDKKALPDTVYENQNKKQIKMPQNDTEKALVDIMCEMFGILKIGVEEKFMEIGGDSLKAISYIQKIFKSLNVKIPLKNVFIHQSAREMAEYIHTMKREQFNYIGKAQLKDYYIASFAQRRIYVLSQYQNIGLTYHIPYVLQIRGNLDRKALNHALQVIICKHESFRTSFEMVDEDVVQKIWDQVEFELAFLECEERDLDKNISKYVKAYDLSKPPLIRACLIATAPETYYLVCDIHHIIFDGFSLPIFIHNLVDLYNGKEVMQPKINYKDYSEWQMKRFHSNEYIKMKSFWTEEMKIIRERKKFYTDYERKERIDFCGSRVILSIEDHVNELVEYVDKKGTTLAIVLLSLFNVLLYKYFGKNLIVVGMPVAGRVHADLEDVIGLFMNTVPVYTVIQNDETLSTLLEEVKTHMFEIYENQDYPIDTLFDDTVTEGVRSTGLYDVMFIMQNFEVPLIKLGNAEVKSDPVVNKTSKIDMTMEAIRKDDTLHISIEYKESVYKMETITDLINDYKKLIDIMLLNDEMQIKEIELKPTKRYSVSESINLENIEFDF